MYISSGSATCFSSFHVSSSLLHTWHIAFATATINTTVDNKGYGSLRIGREMGSETFVEIILAILLPPVGVFLRYGCGVEFWIDLLLTILGYIPGIIYAIYVLVG